MSFGWAAGDLAICINICFKIYQFCSTAEGNLRNIFDRFKYMRDQLVTLEDLLLETGWKKPYRFAADLKADLEGHDEFFEKLSITTSRSPKQNARIFARPLDMARLALKQDELNGIMININDHRSKLKEFKSDIVLQIVLRRLHQQTSIVQQRALLTADSASLPATSEPDRDSRISDTRSIFSRAQESLSKACQINHDHLNSHHHNPSLSTPSAMPRTLDRAARRIHAYINEVVEAAEIGRLYARDVDFDQQMEQLQKIGEALDNLREKISSASPESKKSMALPMLPNSPQSFEDSLRAGLASTDGDVQEFWQYTPPSSVVPAQSLEGAKDREPAVPAYGQPHHHPETDLPTEGGRIPAFSFPEEMSVALPPVREDVFSRSADQVALQVDGDTDFASSISQEDRGQPSSNYPASLNLKGKVFVSGHRLMHGSTVSRHLTIASSETSTHIRAGPEPTIMTPSRLFSHRSDGPVVYRHAFMPSLRSFPRILHPAIDIDATEPQAPYTIHFIRPQFSDIEDHQDSNDESDQLKYHFEDKDDREVVREAIFGKTLLASVGVVEVMLNDTTVCDLESVSLWIEDRGSQSDPSPLLSITVAVCSKRERYAQPVMNEYSILPHVETAKCLAKARKRGTELTLAIQAAPSRPASEIQPATRQNSAATTNTNATTSTWRDKLRRASTAQSKGDFIHIRFSENTPEFESDKAAFIDELEDALLPPSQPS